MENRIVLSPSFSQVSISIAADKCTRVVYPGRQEESSNVKRKRHEQKKGKGKLLVLSDWLEWARERGIESELTWISGGNGVYTRSMYFGVIGGVHIGTDTVPYKMHIIPILFHPPTKLLVLSLYSFPRCIREERTDDEIILFFSFQG